MKLINIYSIRPKHTNEAWCRSLLSEQLYNIGPCILVAARTEEVALLMIQNKMDMIQFVKSKDPDNVDIVPIIENGIVDLITAKVGTTYLAPCILNFPSIWQDIRPCDNCQNKDLRFTLVDLCRNHKPNHECFKEEK